jgi:starch-binding outer membrane protein, SusD/RagB family
MKNINYIKIVTLSIIFSLAVTSCNRDFPNPNNPIEEVVLNSKAGLFALSVGLNQYYTTSVIRLAYELPGITTRELGPTNTFLNVTEPALGGGELTGESGAIVNPWVALLRAKGMTESLLASVDNVPLTDATRSSLIAYASLYKAMTLGFLIQMYEQAPINNSLDGLAQYSDRATVLAECIALLENGRDELLANPVSDDFKSKVLGSDMDLSNSINAFLSRYNLLAGNYTAAIASADAVLNSANQQASVFAYDDNNVNPIWDRTANSSQLDPQANFGLVGTYIPEAGDGRVDFYLGADKGLALADYGAQPLSEMKGFYETSTSSIPVYLKGEMLLNKAEAYARQNMLADAVTQLDLVRTKNNDPLGVDANLAPWAGNAASQADILEEIYKNRCIELFMTGMRLEDSRRFHPDYPTAQSTTNERNRNFYPYPTIERENNPNTPADPSI